MEFFSDMQLDAISPERPDNYNRVYDKEKLLIFSDLPIRKFY